MPDRPDACPVCGSPELRSLRTYRNRGRSITSAAELVLVGCERCGVAFSHPLPTPAEADAYYSVEGWDKVSGRTPEKLERRREGKLARHALELELLAERVPELRPPVDGAAPRALDFGCGTGEWLDVLVDHGYEVRGLEPAGSAREIAAERHVIVDELPDVETFDLVLLNHVIEHLLDPVGTLSAVAAAMRPGGHLFVSVPDLSLLPSHRKLNYVASGVHIFSYTPASLRSLLALAGFETVAQLNGPRWRELGRQPPTRLKMLGRKGPGAALPAGRPLEEAVKALAAYDRGTLELERSCGGRGARLRHAGAAALRRFRDPARGGGRAG